MTNDCVVYDWSVKSHTTQDQACSLTKNLFLSYPLDTRDLNTGDSKLVDCIKSVHYSKMHLKRIINNDNQQS